MLSWQVHNQVFQQHGAKNRLLERRMWVLRTPTHTHTPGRFSRSRSGRYQFRLYRFLALQCEKVYCYRMRRCIIETTEVCRHNPIHIQYIDLPWLIIVQEEECCCVSLEEFFLRMSSVILETKSESIICMWQLWNRNPCVCILLSHIALIFINPTQNDIRQCGFKFFIQKKKNKRSSASITTICVSDSICVLPRPLWDKTICHTVEGCFIITTVLPDATSHSIENSQLPVFRGLLIPAMTSERWKSWT